MSVTIRTARPGDEADILRLITALAVYETEPDAVKATEDSLRATLFGEVPRVWAHLAELDGRVVGLALWFLTYSTWTGKPTLYLEDLFVEETARGTGTGLALFRALAAEAKARDCGRMDWAVLDWNETAKRFYSHIGGQQTTGWETWRLEGEALERLAGE
jgi:GNAT superfamily N-acetyltransferase